MADDPNGEAAGIAFLEANRAKPGVVSLPTGLQYKVLVEGAGLKHPTVDSPCECHYAGMLLDGTTFDSSYKRGKPSTFAPNQVIKGWTQAMQLMVVGDKWEMYIPYELAYGANGKPPKIPAKAMLIFVMEIVRIKGDSTPVTNFPAWAPDDLALWTAKGRGRVRRVARGQGQEVRGRRREASSQVRRPRRLRRLARQAVPVHEEPGAVEADQGREARRAGADASSPPPPDEKPKLDAKIARKLLDGCLAAITVPATKEKLVKIVEDIEGTGDESQKGMLRMVKLMPVVSEILAPVLDDHGYARTTS
ncbi:FK506 binding protein [Aureococcus anophagefferens]|nr:FK506 binding protein [Aureococcus anophagefferens]